MTGRRCLSVLLLLLLGTAACSDTDGEVGTTGPSSTALPSPAGESEATTVALLPEGPATGDLVITYDGLGELRAPFSGECATEGETTTVSGSADTAAVALEFSPAGSSVAVDDDGLRQVSQLGQGDYQVVDATLDLSAPLTQDGVGTGEITLTVTCG